MSGPVSIDPATKYCVGVPSFHASFAGKGGKRCHSFLAESIAVFAVEHVADDAAALGVHFAFAHEGVLRPRRARVGLFRFAATGAAVGKPGLAGPQFELLSANDTGFDRESHSNSMLAKNAG